jgi:hypothetical protein
MKKEDARWVDLGHCTDPARDALDQRRRLRRVATPALAHQLVGPIARDRRSFGANPQSIQRG